jgi:hypothetical protein
MGPHLLNGNAHAQARLGERVKINSRPRKPLHENEQLGLPALLGCEAFADEGYAARFAFRRLP